MTMKETYELRVQRRREFLSRPTAAMWDAQETRFMEPFLMYGNLYYVGDDWVCVHLIDTGDGLLLLDAGNCGAAAMLVHAIWSLGFDPADVKWMVLSHGHVDHIGSANFFKRMFGTRLYLGGPDAEMFEARPEFSGIQDSSDVMDQLFIPDVQIHDGDRIRFGNMEIQFYLVPGHTAGCIACFFDVPGDQGVKRAGCYGGFGFNTLKREVLQEMGDTTLSTRQTYLESLKKVRNEKVELFLGNHTKDNNLVAKRRDMLEHPGSNPFLDEMAWGRYLDQKRDDLICFMENETL